MSAVICPHCNAPLTPQEVAAGWCEACGKKIPTYAIREAGSSYPAERSSAYQESQPYEQRLPSYPGRDFQLPERQPIASLGARLGGALLDGLCGLLAYGPGYLLIQVGDSQRDEAVMVLGVVLLLLGLLILLVVQVVMLSTSGQSIGKRLIGTRIVGYADGRHPGFVGTVLLRSFVPGLIGAVPCLGAIFALVDILFIFGPERRCVHDLIAGTKVIEA